MPERSRLSLAEKSFGYRVIAPTGDEATDTAAWHAWRNASPRPRLSLQPTGQKLVINSAGSPVTMSTGDVWIEGNGVEMVHKFGAGNPLIYVFRSMGPPFTSQDTCVDVTDEDHDISGTGALVYVSRVQLTTPANVSLYPVGSFAMVTSEDVAPHGSSSEGPRMGQKMRIAKIDAVNGYVYLASTLWRSDLYTTDIRITAMPVGETRINNVRFSIEAASGEDIETRNVPVLWLENCVHPRLTNLEIIESASSGMYIANTLGGEISNCTIRKVRFGNGEGAPSNSRAGYGIQGARIDGLRVVNNYFTMCRHGFSTNWTNSSASGATSRHGPCMNILIANNIAAYCKSGGLDLHSDGVNCMLTGNIVYGSRGDNTGGGYSYQMRGESNILMGNADYDCDHGPQIFENTIDGSQDIVVINHVSRSKKYALTFDGNNSSTRKLNAHVIGGIFESKQLGNAAGMVYAEDAQVNFRGTIFRPKGQDGGTIFRIGTGGDTDISGDIVYDASAAAGDWTLLTTAGSGNSFTLKVKRDHVDGAGGNADYVVTDLSPDVISFATTLTADRAVTFDCDGRKTIIIRRTAGGAFNLNVTHSGGTLALAANRAAVFEVHGASVMLISPTITLA